MEDVMINMMKYQRACLLVYRHCVQWSGCVHAVIRHLLMFVGI